MKNNLFKNIKSFKPKQYSSGTTNAKLAAIALLKLEEIKVEITFENVVVILQKLFPGKFSLINYPDIPDTIRVDNTLRLDAKKHGKYLTGNRPKGYKLTPMGRITAEEALEKLKTNTTGSKTTISSTNRNRYTRLVNSVTDSSAFQKFSTKQFAEINKFDVCDVLHGTLETNPEKLLANLGSLKHYAESIKSIKEYEKLAHEVLKLFEYLNKNWETLMHD